MIKNILIILLFVSAGMYSQEHKHEKIKAYKTAYITEKLELSPKEAEEFWPLYNLYDQKFHELRHRERNQIYKRMGDEFCELTDAEASKLIDTSITLEEEGLQIKREMNTALRKAISSKKIVLLRKVEYDFKRDLLHRYRDGKHGKKD